MDSLSKYLFFIRIQITPPPRPIPPLIPPLITPDMSLSWDSASESFIESRINFDNRKRYIVFLGFFSHKRLEFISD